MNKKFLGAILFGALAVASTGSFVSCKDYDDEIDNLQTQINGLASAKDLSDKVSTLQSAITAAQSAAEAKAAAAQTVAEAAKTAADKAVSADDLTKKLNDLAATLATKDELDAVKNLAAAAATQKDLEAAKEAVEKAAKAAADDAAKALNEIADLQTEVKALQEAIEKAAKQETVDALSTKVAALENQVKALNDGKVMVTDISLIEAFNYGTPNQGHSLAYAGNALDLGFKSVTEQTTVFGKGLPGEITFDATKSHSIQKSNIIVRVNPANATVAKEDIKLVNSKGEALEQLEVIEVKPYDGLITRAADNTGLWTITVQTKEDVTMEALTKATTTKVNNAEKKICYAVAIGDESRSVVSSYDITAAPRNYTASYPLGFYVSDKDANLVAVADIHNRFAYAEDETSTTSNEEMGWYNAVSGKSVIPAIVENIVKETKAADKLYQNVVKRDETDNRQGKNFLAVEVDKPIDLYIEWNKADKKVANDIKGFYVAYDERNAVESAPSEINAWKSYEVENLNTVQAGNTGSITIKSPSANGDIIGFRVYAVNLDGTLLDPDGRAFYVYVGDATKFGTIATQPILAVKAENSATTTDFLADFKTAVEGVKNNAYTATGWTNTKKPELKDKNGNKYSIAGSLFKVVVDDVEVTSANIMTIDFAKAKKVQYVMPNAQDFVDGGTYEQKMEIFKTVGNTKVLVKTITVSFTKVLPSEAPVVTYITGQNSELLLAPVANPTTLAEFGGSGTAPQAAINLNNVYYELSRATAGSIKYTVNNSVWDPADGKKAYLKDADGSNGAAADGTNLVIANNDDAAFKAITDGSAHTLKFAGYYANVSYAPNADNTAMVKGSFSTKETTDFDVTYNCWDKFTTWEWTSKGGLVVENIDKNDVVTKSTFNSQIQWTTEGKMVIWPASCIVAKNTKNPEIFNTSFDKYAFCKVVNLKDPKDIYLQDVVNPNQINNYFTPSWDDEKGFVFEYTQNSSNPAADVEQILKMKVTDVFGHEIVLELGKVKILRQK